MLHTFSGGGEGRERGGQIRKGAKHAGEALCWATVPLRETTVEKLEMRRRGEEERGWEAGGGLGRKWRGGRSEAQGTSGECGNFLCWQCSTTLCKSASGRTADVPG